MSRAGLESSHRGRIDDDMESKEGHMGATKDLCRWVAAAAPELGLIGLVVEDHGRSALMRQARAVTETFVSISTLKPG